MSIRILAGTLFVGLCLSSCSKLSPLPKESALDLGDKVAMQLRLIPVGKFLMGSKSSAAEMARRYGGSEAHHANEHPRHKVTISKPFYMGIHEVSQAQWRAVMGTEPWKGRWYCDKIGADTPACCIGWDDANRFCEMLSKKTGRKVVLPTEAQWEYACRAGTNTEYHFGDDVSKLGDYAWYNENAYKKGADYPHASGRKKPNAWGLYDMHGNVWEWCRDWYDQEYYAKAKDVDPVNSTEARHRVLRGGSWLDPPYSCRAANRVGYTFYDNKRTDHRKGHGGFHSGFRVVVTSGSGVD